MSNYSWRRFRLEVLEFIEIAEAFEANSKLIEELQRMRQIVDYGDEIKDYPRIYSEAPSTDSLGLTSELELQYSKILDGSKALTLCNQKR